MKSKQLKGIWIVLAVVILTVSAYYLGTVSKNSTESTQNTQDITKLTAIQQQIPIHQTTQKVTTGTETPKSPQDNVITNSPACLTIANQAAKNEAAKTGNAQDIRVLQAHFKQSTGNCYYELQDRVDNPTSPSVTISINYAPNDESIAFCTNVPNLATACLLNSSTSSINESTFHLIEAQYLEN